MAADYSCVLMSDWGILSRDTDAKRKQTSEPNRFGRAGGWTEGRCSVLGLQQRGEAEDSSDPGLGDTPLKFQQDAAPASKNIVNAATRACDAVHTGRNLDSLLLVLHLHSSKLTESLLSEF